MATKTPKKKETPRKYSSIYVEGAHRAPSRSMLRAVGFTDRAEQIFDSGHSVI